MKLLTIAIKAAIADLSENLDKAFEGNKAAGARARKNTLELDKLFKQYRKKSIEALKK